MKPNQEMRAMEGGVTPSNSDEGLEGGDIDSNIKLKHMFDTCGIMD